MDNWTINEILAEIYQQRRRQNPRFSVRAFAHYLQVSNSSLSQILRKKRVVGPSLAEKFEKRLGIKFDKSSYELKKKKPLKFQSIPLEENQQPIPWYAFALLELFKAPLKSFDSKKLASAFGISESELAKTLTILENRGYISRQDGTFTISSDMASTYLSPVIASHLAKTYQTESAQKSLEAIQNTEFSERVHNSLHFSFDPANLPEIRECAQRFLKDLAKIAAKNSKTAKSVYMMQTSIFPVFSFKEMLK